MARWQPPGEQNMLADGWGKREKHDKRMATYDTNVPILTTDLRASDPLLDPSLTPFVMMLVSRKSGKKTFLNIPNDKKNHTWHWYGAVLME